MSSALYNPAPNALSISNAGAAGVQHEVLVGSDAAGPQQLAAAPVLTAVAASA